MSQNVITDYTLNKAAGTVTLSGIATVEIPRVIRIFNISQQEIVHEIGLKNTIASVAGSVITLNAVGVATITSNSDVLQVTYDSGGDVSASNQLDEITATNRAGTREYNMAAITRQAVGAASARVALPTLGASRELYVMASTRCFFLSGDSSILAAAGTSHPLAADERFHLRIPAGHTHIAYIRDSADGFISIAPVA